MPCRDDILYIIMHPLFTFVYATKKNAHQLEARALLFTAATQIPKS